MATLQQVVFQIEGEDYGVDIMKISSIEHQQTVVKVPNSPEYVDGIINLRGEVLPVFNLRRKFHITNGSGMLQGEKAAEAKIIVAHANDMKIGFVVDEVDEIINIDEKDIEPTPKILKGIDRKYIKSVAKVGDRMIILLDIDLLITDEEKLSLGEAIDNVTN